MGQRSCGRWLAEQRRRSPDGAADTRIGSAATEIREARDVVLARRWLAREHRRGGHDLAGLAVAALRHVLFDPGALDRVQAGRPEPFDSGNATPRRAGDRQRAGTHRLAVDVHRARAAQSRAAAELGAGEPRVLAQVPQQRHLRIAIELDWSAVELETRHGYSLARRRLCEGPSIRGGPAARPASVAVQARPGATHSGSSRRGVLQRCRLLRAKIAHYHAPHEIDQWYQRNRG